MLATVNHQEGKNLSQNPIFKKSIEKIQTWDPIFDISKDYVLCTFSS